jgi:HK97 family phage major capsid protein
MSLIDSKQLREKRAALVEQNRAVLAQMEAKDVSEARVKELEAEWDRRDAEIDGIAKQIERAEKQESRDADLARPVAERRSGRIDTSAPSQMDGEAHAKAYRDALFHYLRFGMEDLSAEQRNMLRGRFQMANGETRAMSTTVAAGGYAIPEGFYNELQDNMLAFGGARDGATVLTTSSGNAIPIPTSDATTQKAQIVGEGSALSSPQDPTFGVVTLNAFMYRSLILISLELLQDSAFNMEAWIKAKLAEYVARGTNTHFTTGNGSSQPQGYITGGTSGHTADASNAVSYNDLVSLEHSVDPAYRRGAGVRWKFADSTLKLLKQLKDSENRPLWLPGLAVREPDTILGYRYTINQDMAAVEASAKSVAFGDFAKFFVRDVSNMLIVRANELHIANGQIGFYVFSRHDSAVVDAGTDPIRFLTHPSP